jgi:hypothetical protein
MSLISVAAARNEIGPIGLLEEADAQVPGGKVEIV